ncbi:aminoglycoside phosphotransferase family protein [Streptomyces guryensis]|uniref:Aminoglycoside phosphotransferase family protein n=1 Tax=Streptomyces guryensis TaxID=2886947 RepID=A0A9Q3VXE9_9ACTN|nr:aminoglycoside phosphotransferase family protein [Streptomyces guryensis]MCD9880314.1 aminoglycoside phosphotransferase family protein [Streptomyces guryensis]
MVDQTDAFLAFVADAKSKAQVSNGHHNQNYVHRLPENVARLVGQAPFTQVMVRIRRQGVLPVVIRTWQSEAALLRAVRDSLPHVPQCLHSGLGFAIHSYAEGVPLSAVCGNGKPVDTLIIKALADLLAQLTRVRRTALPLLPAVWPTNDTDSQAFLRTLALQADEQIRKPNWDEYGGLFKALGIPDIALLRFADRVPAMARRPYSLLHADLHRDNVIMTYDPGAAPLVCVDWELATYGDPLHDLATHLVRMRYPPHQWEEVIGAWVTAMQGHRPAAVTGYRADLCHYLDFERAQSVYPDVMRAAQSLERSFTQKSLDQATDEVCRALKEAAKPLRLRRVPRKEEISGALFRWLAARHDGDVSGRDWIAKAFDWERDRRVALPRGFGETAVRNALLAEGAAAAERVFKGTAHLNTVVQVPDYPHPLVVRRKLPDVSPREARHLDEHAVLRAIHTSKTQVAVPRVLALGKSYRGEPFALQTYVGLHPDQPPSHPVKGLLPHEADALVDQLCELTKVEYREIDSGVGQGAFYEWLTDELVCLVQGLPPESRRLARVIGLPDAGRLRQLLARHKVHRREAALLHGDLNPWNLVRRNDHLALTIIDWEMALVGDPLYELVRHIHLTPTKQAIRERMFDRWEKNLPAASTRNWRWDWRVYRGIEIVRSAYIDLDRQVTGVGLDAPNVRRAVDAYAETLKDAQVALGLPVRPLPNPYLGRAIAGEPRRSTRTG